MLDAAPDLGTLATLPGNRLEALKGNRKGQHSIRVNDQRRICFVWREGHAYQVEIADYHYEGEMAKKLKAVHPGEILKEEFMLPLGLSMNKMAMDLRPGDPDRQYRQREARNYRGHSTPLRPLLQERAGILDESPNPLRFGSGRGRTRRQG
jgi:RelE-like toxin of type II toxin-antitoxin system HigB